MDPIMAPGKQNLSWNDNDLLQFRIQGHLQKQGILMPVYQNLFRRKSLKFIPLSRPPFCFLAIKIL